MLVIPPEFKIDIYKAGHLFQMPPGTTEVYSNFTPRASRLPGVDKVVVWGLQPFFVRDLIDAWDDEFFGKPLDKILARYQARMDRMIGPGTITVGHIAALHKLGYLPVRIKALPEGSLCPMRVPFMTWRNTHQDFAWVTNYIETHMSCSIWHPITSATTCWEFYKEFYRSAKRSAPDKLDFASVQGHDFSMRGQTSLESATAASAAHLLSFIGTDTVPALDYLEEHYGPDDKITGVSVRASEHMVMQMGGKDTELETYRRLISDVAPSGIISIVSDTWDYWNVIDNILPALKDVIMARDGRVVVRPDSGSPVKILCGDEEQSAGSSAHKGTIEALYDSFGGSLNNVNCKELDPHIGVIYGDSITRERQKEINERLWQKRFASVNWVAGVGSFALQHVTRDTFGFAIKTTHGVIDGVPVDLFKDPKTDDGTKRSARGYLRVNEDYTLKECCTPEEEEGGLLEVVFENSMLVRKHSFSEVRERLHSNLEK